MVDRKKTKGEKRRIKDKIKKEENKEGRKEGKSCLSIIRFLLK